MEPLIPRQDSRMLVVGLVLSNSRDNGKNGALEFLESVRIHNDEAPIIDIDSVEFQSCIIGFRRTSTRSYVVRTCAAANAYVFDDDDGAFSPESGWDEPNLGADAPLDLFDEDMMKIDRIPKKG